MRKRQLLISCIAILFIHQPVLSTAAPGVTREIAKAYAAADYSSVADLLKQQIKQYQEQSATNNNKANFDNYTLYRLHLQLAHTYAWKLNRFDAALAEYQKAHDRNQAQQQLALAEMAKRQMPQQQMNMPAFEFLFVGGMYAQKKNYQKALAYYRQILPTDGGGADDFGNDVMAGSDVLCLVHYMIDGIQLKLKPASNYTPLVKKLNLLHATNPQILTLMIAQLLPEMDYAGHLAEKTGLHTFIKTSPANIHQMLLEYMLIVNATAGSMNPSAQQALAAFLAKYPDSYFSLSLRNLLVRYYKQNEDEVKANQYMQELTDIARSRHMELITEPDKRFLTPENTWETFKEAFKAGDNATALSCHIPGDEKSREIYKDLGKETMKKIVLEMRDIEKITMNNEMAKYRIKRLIEGTDITFYIYFVNINGEWKIQQF